MAKKDETFELYQRIDNLTNTVKAAQDARDYYANELHQLKMDIYNAARSAPMQVDFRKMNAFSIERIYENDQANTVIGHKHNITANKVEIKEWRLECNDETHNRLVAEFNEYRKGK